MVDIFKRSGWTSLGSNEASLSAGEAVGVSVSKGEMFFNDPFGTNYKFNFATAGASFGLGAPLSLDFTATELPAKGLVYTNSKWRDTLSASDFKGAFLVYQGKEISLFGAGASGSIIFFDIGMGLYSSFLTTMATAGAGVVIAPAEVMASCSAVFISAGMVLGMGSISASGALGIIHSFEKQQSNVVGVWKVTANGKIYKYAFYDNGSCSWWKNMNMLNPDGAGRWSINGDYLEINWDSGSYERWDMPISTENQKGYWTDPNGKVSPITAYKTDIYNLFK